MGRKTKRKRPENFEPKPGREKPDQGREHVTKYLQKVYNFVAKESDLFWGLKDQDIVPSNSKRVPGAKRIKTEPPKKEKTAETEETEEPEKVVSEGYGEATLGSISRLLRTLETLEEEELRLSRNSTFVDIGSGYGKVVFHARLFSRVKKSDGIEYVQRRCDIAQRAQDHFRWKHIVDAGQEETNKENHAGNEKKVEEELAALLDEEVSFVCDDATNRSPFNYSHIYMYDCIFSEDTYEKLLPQLEESPFKVLVCFRTLPFLTVRGLKHIRPLGNIKISSTGRQCFTAHMYAKTREGEVFNTTNASTTTEQPQDLQIQDTPMHPIDQPQIEPQIEPQIPTQTQTQIHTQTETETQTQIHTQKETQTEPKTQTETQTEPKTQTETQIQPQTKTHTGTHAENFPETQTQTKTQAETHPEIHPKTLTKAQNEPQSEHQTERITQTNIPTTRQTKSEPTQELQPNKSEPQQIQETQTLQTLNNHPLQETRQLQETQLQDAQPLLQETQQPPQDALLRETQQPETQQPPQDALLQETQQPEMEKPFDTQQPAQETREMLPQEIQPQAMPHETSPPSETHETHETHEPRVPLPQPQTTQEPLPEPVQLPHEAQQPQETQELKHAAQPLETQQPLHAAQPHEAQQPQETHGPQTQQDETELPTTPVAHRIKRTPGKDTDMDDDGPILLPEPDAEPEPEPQEVSKEERETAQKPETEKNRAGTEQENPHVKEKLTFPEGGAKEISTTHVA